MNQKQEFIQNEMELVNSMIEGDLSWEEYMPHYQGLADDEKPIAAYLLAMGGKSSGHGFMRRLQADRDVKYPFMFSGWAGKHNDLGPMFQITRECFFLEEDPLLFYTDDDLIYCGPKYQSDAQYLAEQIEKHSSGVKDVNVQMLSMYGMQEPVLGITFRLASASIRETVELNGAQMKTSIQDGYFFALPKAGEFECVLGKVTDSGCINLHYDSFCMK